MESNTDSSSQEDINDSANESENNSLEKSSSERHVKTSEQNGDIHEEIVANPGDTKQTSTKKKSRFKKLMFWRKNKEKHDNPPKPDTKKKQTFICDEFSDIPIDWQKNIIKEEISQEMSVKRFKILLNVLHFITKDSFRMSNQEKEERERRTFASKETLDIAIQRIKEDNEKAIKKLFRNIEFSEKGGFGRVFSAKDINKKCRVAIKKVPHDSEKSISNNRCEVGFLATCKHPNIVKFIESWFVQDKGELWIVTEFLEGGTLSEAVEIHQFSETHIAYVAREMLKALKYLHSIGLVHRDLKSGNVMMSIEGEIKLIDFGLCCDVKDGPRKQMLGSPFWIPPEMIKNEFHSYPADIWSFAVCIIEMYLKEPPNAHSRLYALYTASTKGLKASIPKHASPAAKDFLKKCLVINPNKRATAEELLEHPFVKQPNLNIGIRDVLRSVFVNNSLALSGI